jgi:hypothetical protein
MEEIVCPQCGAFEDYHIVESGPHLKAVCNCCDAYIKFIPQPHETPRIFFGKYKGREVRSLVAEEEIRYLQWLYHNANNLKAKTKQAIHDHLLNLNRL